MDILQAMEERHSVRSYTGQDIEEAIADQLQALTDECNAESGLHIQLVLNEPKAYDGFLAHYGKFSGVTSYLAMVGPKGASLSEKVGYYGEKLVIRAQQLGLRSCWTGLTYSKTPGAFEVGKGEKLVLTISLGYGKEAGRQHKSKTPEEVMKVDGEAPEWFLRGVRYALLAPTSINQQKFTFSLHPGGKVSCKAGIGPYSKVDLGIVKYHFEVAAGLENFSWV